MKGAIAFGLLVPLALAGPTKPLAARGAVCGNKGYNKDIDAYDYITKKSARTYAGCSALCVGDSHCSSFAVGGGACLLYTVPV